MDFEKLTEKCLNPGNSSDTQEMMVSEKVVNRTLKAAYRRGYKDAQQGVEPAVPLMNKASKPVKQSPRAR